MIKQVFNVESYWKVIVWYSLDYNLFYLVEEDLREAGISRPNLETLYWMMHSGRAKAVTFSNEILHVSIVIFNIHESKADYIDSIVHEAEHVKQDMLRYYQVEDEGEPPAYTIGYLISQMYQVFQHLICNCRES